MGIRQWKLPEHHPDTVRRLAAETGKPELVCHILAARGLTDPEQIADFFAEEQGLSDPFLLADMDRAVERVSAAIENGERICVYGDYDCDGITATALLTGYLQAVGADVIYYLPNREKNGYGLHTGAIDMLAEQKVELIITVDNGVSAHAEIAHAAALGIDVVVTDHHTPRDTLPAAAAVVNPHRADCPSRCRNLAGVGVAYKLVCALEGAQEEMLEYYSQLVMLGTVADVVPLTGENRIIVRHGLARLAETESPGLAALIEISGLQERTLTSETVAFGLAPRINAAGRVGIPDDVVELLLTDDPSYAQELAETLDRHNTERKKIEAEILQEIEGMLAENPQILNGRVLLLAGNNWHHGVVGIVSAKMAERYEKPCLLFSLENGEARGSGRSIEGFSLIEAITACSAHLTRFGGHVLAAGLTLPQQHLAAFCEELQAFARQRYPVMPVPVLTADCVLTPQQLTVETISQLAVLEPFGACNEAPLFCLQNLVIEGIYPTADRRHIRVRLTGGTNSFYAIYFGVSDTVFPYKAGETVDIMAKINVGEYNGKATLSIKLSDLRLGDVPQEQVLLGRERYARYLRGEQLAPETAAEMLPGRDEIATVYKFLRRAGRFPYGPGALYLRLMAGGLDYCHLLLALDVLEEMGFVTRTVQDGAVVLAVVPDAPRADLSRSAILGRLEKMKLPAASGAT